MSRSQKSSPRGKDDKNRPWQSELLLTGRSEDSAARSAVEPHKHPATVRELSVNKNSTRPDVVIASQEIASKFDMHPALARVFATRGHKSDFALEQYLNPKVEPFLSDLGKMTGFDRGCELHAEAIRKKKPIVLFGDFDVDGISSVLQPYLLDSHFGVESTVILPNRLTHGYDLQMQDVEGLRGQKQGLLKADDLGTYAHAPILLAKALGWKTVVTDHHECHNLAPHPADAFRNPKQPGCQFSGGFPNAGILSWLDSYGTWKILLSSTDPKIRAKAKKYDPFDRLDVAAMSAIADRVPLTGITRAIVKEGLPKIGRTSLLGLAQLDEQIGAKDGSMAERVGFYLAPAINAASRMADASVAFNLLIETDRERARSGAQALIDLNTARKKVERADFFKAIDLLDQMSSVPAGILLSGDFYLGTIGIVAARMVGLYQRSVLLVAPAVRPYDGFNPGEVRTGSGRTTEGRDLLASLESIRPHLIQLGGHAPAVGLAVHKDNVSLVQELFAKSTAEETYAKGIRPEVVGDVEVTLAEIDSPKLWADIQNNGPWGQGEEEPVFVIRGLTIRSVPEISPEGHIAFMVGEGLKAMPARLWHQVGYPKFGYGQKIDLAFQAAGDPTHRYLKVRMVQPTTASA